MRQSFVRSFAAAFAFVASLSLVGVAEAQSYKLDEAHSSFVFKIKHAGVSYTYGMFTDASGAFTIDAAAPAKSAFDITIKADSITTGNAKRDEHLRGPDFFSTKEFPTLTFKSTGVTKAEGGYAVTGDLKIHGVSKPVTFVLKALGDTEFPKGVKRSGFATELTIKRSEFGMTNMVGPIADEVSIMISFEGIVK